MTKFLISASVLALTVGSVAAADLPYRKAPAVMPAVAPPPMWTGFYVGLNAGGTWANSNTQYVGVGPVGVDPFWPVGFFDSESATQSANYVAAFLSAASASGRNGGGNVGFIGGGQIGYNWQFLNSLVVGFETDIQGIAGTSNNGTSITSAPAVSAGPGYLTTNFVGVNSLRGGLNFLGTVRGRLGWLATPSLLIYGTGGLAYGGATLSSATMVYNDLLSFEVNNGVTSLPASAGFANYSNTRTGWTAGGGLEWMFWPNWSAKIEYLYYDLGTIQTNFSMLVTDNVSGLNAAFAGQTRARINGNIVRAGVNYHFNWGALAPVVANF